MNTTRASHWRACVWWTSAIGVVGLLTIGVGAWKHHQARRFKHFAVHRPNELYRSAWLEGDAVAALIRQYGLRSVVNLCEPDEMSDEMLEGERIASEANGARLHRVPLPTSTEWRSANWSPHLAIIRDPRNYPMLVHCQHGIKRTGMFIAVHDALRHDVSALGAVKKMPWFGHTHRAKTHVHAFAKNFDQYRHGHPAELSGETTIQASSTTSRSPTRNFDAQ